MMKLVVLAMLVMSGSLVRAQTSPGPLSLPHVRLEGAANCVQCHETRKSITAAKCLSCHKALGARIVAKRGLHAQPGYEKCERCHNEHHGRGSQLIYWGTKPLDHRVTGYPLLGAHARAGCGQCHKTRSYLGLSTICTSCHHDAHRGQFATNTCASCHTMTAWKPPTFSHANARFSLTGKHASLSCKKCHPAGKFKPLAHGRCNDCHRDPHAARFGASCTNCHSTSGFKPAKFDHGLLPKQSCMNCHKKRDVHAARLGNRCEQCHRTTGWTPAVRKSFDHARTRFALTDRHRAVACTSCHVKSALRAPTVCSSCHRDPHGGRLGTTCDQCHSTSGFEKIVAGAFHHDQTRFPLSGAHTSAECAQCHAKRKTPTQCSGCHEDVHKGQFQAAECSTCHNTERFLPERRVLQ